MYFLVTDSDKNRWSFCDGYMIFKYVVCLGFDTTDTRKYKLIDENGNDLKVNISDYIKKDIYTPSSPDYIM